MVWAKKKNFGLFEFDFDNSLVIARVRGEVGDLYSASWTFNELSGTDRMPTPDSLHFDHGVYDDAEDWTCRPYLGEPTTVAILRGYFAGFALMMLYLIAIPLLTIRFIFRIMVTTKRSNFKTKSRITLKKKLA